MNYVDSDRWIESFIKAHVTLVIALDHKASQSTVKHRKSFAKALSLRENISHHLLLGNKYKGKMGTNNLLC